MDTRRWYAFSILCIAVLLCFGCTGADTIAVKTRQLEELRFEKARIRESLSESITEVEHVKRKLAAVDSEKNEAIQSGEALREQLRFANEQLAGSKRDQEKLAISVEDSEARSTLLERSLEKVKAAASTSATELFDLRLKSRAFESQRTALRVDNEKLRKERAKLSSMTSDLQEEVRKSQAVVRSIRAGTEDTDRFRDLEKELDRLYKENADLRGEKLTLDQRVANVESREAELSQLLAKSSIAAADGVPFSIDAVKSELVYKNDPGGLVDEVGGFVAARYDNWMGGGFEGDAFDISAIGFASFLLLIVVAYMVRSRRIRRLKREIEDLRDEIDDFESAESERGAEVEQRVRQDVVPRTPRIPGSRTRSGFSGVISNRPLNTPPVEKQEAAEPPRAKVPPKPSGPVVGTLSGAVSSGQRKVIGARTWSEPEALVEDDLANTQVIPNGFEEEFETETLVPPSPETESLELEEKAASEDDLLAELKAVINKKFDEIV